MESIKEFKNLKIIEPILRSIEEQKFTKPTLIQKNAIPKVLQGKDVIITSATGTGKTLIYAARVIEIVESNSSIQALILAPTRDLAKQIKSEIERYAKYYKIDIALVCGGHSINTQREELKTANIVIGTTGRLIDHINQNNINLTNLKTLIIDEADLMIAKDFIEDIEKIIEISPNYIQKVMLSATITQEILKLASKYMNEPVKITAQFQIDKDKLTQVYYNIENKLKLSLLIHMLKYQKAGLSLIFANRQETATIIIKTIKKYTDLEVGVIHGGLSQGKRNRVVDDFKNQKLDVVVATDIAARGLDINYISHIYNYNVPKDIVKYTHRIGRTARAGNNGKIINFVSPQEEKQFREMLGENIKNFISKNTPDIDIIKDTPKIIQNNNNNYKNTTKE